MKTLYLIRHAKSSWDEAHLLPDLERGLNTRGRRDAPFMASLLQHQHVQPDALVSSPAVRAMLTAQLFAEQFDYPLSEIAVQPSIYELSTSTQKILKAVQQLRDDWQTVFLFGHNPTFTEFANLYTNTANHIENIPTCGIVCLDFEVESWADVTAHNGRVLSFEYPKKYYDSAED